MQALHIVPAPPDAHPAVPAPPIALAVPIMPDAASGAPTQPGAVSAAPAQLGAVLIVAGLPREAALGRAVAQIMARPAFARAPFGHVVRALAGQVNRGHYAFAVRDGRPVGFAGWALVAEPTAEDWLAGRRGFSDAEARAGDCLVLNVWQADAPEVSRALIAHLSATVTGVRRLYARRIYPDGRIRPVRLDLRQRRDPGGAIPSP